MLSRVSAHAAGKSKAELLGKLAEGTISSVLGNEATAFLTNLGVFDVLGLGGGPDPVINAKLDQIIKQLQVIQADITELQTDVATLTSTVGHDTDLIQLNALLHDMEDASGAIQRCGQQVTLVAQAPGSDATDAQMNDFALQMVGRRAGQCDLSTQFSTIHTRIVTDQVLGDAESAFYVLLARVAHDNGIEFERVASHFIQYQIIQREALELIRGAYSALGEASNLQTVFTQAPTNFLGALKDEEIAFLQAADAYVTAQPPPYTDLSPAALADAIVQRLEGVTTAASTFSLSVLDNAVAVTPHLTSPDTATTLAYGDAITGAVTTYYAMPDTTLTAGIRDSCLATPASDGFSFVRPDNGLTGGGGFKIGSGCTLHLERHLMNNVPAQVQSSWQVAARKGSVPVGDPILRNAASLNAETAAENLALGGDPAGRASGYSKLTVIADTTNPSLVSLSVDLPSAPATPIIIGAAHPFAAGPGDPVVFTRVPYGADYPDRYALQHGASYLAIDDTGFAAETDTPTFFDFQKTSDGYVELVYAGGIVFVDVQYVQWFFGESPDDVWANTTNLASGTAALAQWGSPSSDNYQPGHVWGDPLLIYPPCANGLVPTLNIGPGMSEPITECSTDSYPYVIYEALFFNDDDFDRAIGITIGGTAVNPFPYPLSLGLPNTYAGLHCYQPSAGSPNDHLDVGAVDATGSGDPVSLTAQTFDNSNRALTVPAHGTLALYCQILDLVGEPARVTIDTFTVSTCKNTTGACEVWP